MVTENIDIVIRERGARLVRRKLEDIGKTAKNASRGIHILQQSLYVLGAAGTVASLGRMLDSLTNFENRLRLVTESTEELESVQERLLGVAERTRSSFDVTGQIYSRTALSVRELGISQQETLNFTESLNQAVILSGASIREANAALIQLSQGLASDRLSGDELRSVLEQLPFVADVIATELGVTRGELRKLGSDGEITAEIILRAFRNMRGEINEKFAETVSTIAQAFEVFRTNMLGTLDAFDDATGFSAGLANSIIALSESLDVILPILGAFAVALGARFGAKIISQMASALAAEIKFQNAVRNGTVIVLGSKEAENARAQSILATAAAKTRLEQTTVRELATQRAQIASQLQALRADQASIALNKAKQTAINTLTGETIAYDVAVKRNLATTHALNIAEQNLVSTKRALIAAIGAERAATIQLATAQAGAASAAAAANTFGARLVRLVPGLGLVVGAFGTIISLLGGPISAAFIAVIAIMALWTTRAEAIEVSTRRLEGLVYDVQEAYASVNGEVDKIADALQTITEVEAVRELQRQTELLRDSQRALAGELISVSARFIELGENGRFVNQFLQQYREQAKAGTIDTEEFREVISNLAQGSGQVFQGLLVSLIETSRELDTTRANAETAEAILAVLRGTATDAQRALLGLSTGADNAAGSIRRMGTAALGSINALRTLQGFVPELARAARIQDDLNEAQNVYQIGLGRAGQRLSSGVGSIDDYVKSITELEEAYNRAVSEINGTAEAQRNANDAFEEYSAETALSALDDRQRALALETQRYEEVRKQIEGTENATSRLAELEAQHVDRLARINAEFDEMGSPSGSAGGATSSVKGLNEVMEQQKRIFEEIQGPVKAYKTEIEALNNLVASGSITQLDFIERTRQARIELLESSNTLQDGFERGFLKIVEKTADIASQMEDIVTRAFDGMSAAIADLVVDGKADFNSLIRSINKMIVQLVISQSFQQLFGNTTSINSKGLFSKFTGFLGNLVDGVFSVGAAAVPGAAAGGSFVVGNNMGFGGLAGHDNRLVPLRLKTGEQVDVHPRGSRTNGSGETHIHNWNITTPNAQSFEASRTQISARAARMISAGRRNM